jgi:hypothetical protein
MKAISVAQPEPNLKAENFSQREKKGPAPRMRRGRMRGYTVSG